MEQYDRAHTGEQRVIQKWRLALLMTAQPRDESHIRSPLEG